MQLLTEKDIINSAPVEEIPGPYSPNPLFILNHFPDSPQMHFEYEHIYLQFLETFHENQSVTDTTITTTTISDLDSNINMLDQEHSRTTEEQVQEVEAEDVVIRKTTKCNNTTTTTTNATTRRSKKDRHSKINTARGPRDRRMRLSLEVARKFFDLQDMLGFDKPSKTVNWLLENSRDAIRELGDGNYSCEVVSSITTSDQDFTCSNHYSSSAPFANNSKGSSSEVETRINSSSSDKNSIKRMIKKKETKKKCLVTVGRESRRRARERARERTSQKRRLSEIITSTTDSEQIRLCVVDGISSAGYQQVHAYELII